MWPAPRVKAAMRILRLRAPRLGIYQGLLQSMNGLLSCVTWLIDCTGRADLAILSSACRNSGQCQKGDRMIGNVTVISYAVAGLDVVYFAVFESQRLPIFNSARFS